MKKLTSPDFGEQGKGLAVFHDVFREDVATIDEGDAKFRAFDFEGSENVAYSGSIGVLKVGDFETVVTKSCKKLNRNFHVAPVHGKREKPN
jgi:hypothetical protein